MPYSNEGELVGGKRRVQLQVSTYPKGSPPGEWLVSGPHTTSRFECPFIEYSHHQISTDGKIHLATSECNRTGQSCQFLSLLGPRAQRRRASYGFGAPQKRRFSGRATSLPNSDSGSHTSRMSRLDPPLQLARLQGLPNWQEVSRELPGSSNSRRAIASRAVRTRVKSDSRSLDAARKLG